MESKDALRAKLRRLREAIAPDERARIDAAIAERMGALPAFAGADFVFTYLSIGSEVDTRQIIREAWRSGKQVAVPRCVPGSRLMRWHRIEGFGGLESGSFGIEEPPDDASTLVEVPLSGSGIRAVAIVPGYSFDAHGYRLGYGGGFYDVFLPAFGGTSAGLCRDCQFSDVPLPHDAHDAAVDLVLTETRLHLPPTQGDSSPRLE